MLNKTKIILYKFYIYNCNENCTLSVIEHLTTRLYFINILININYYYINRGISLNTRIPFYSKMEVTKGLNNIYPNIYLRKLTLNNNKGLFGLLS